MPDSKTSDQILVIARELLATEGLGAISFDSIARRLGRSKQAVLYWFPTKHDLLIAMFIPWLEAEAEIAVNAVAKAVNRAEAIKAFIRAVSEFHFEDLDRFRMMYLVPQTTGTRLNARINTAVIHQVHPVTNRLYNALAEHLGDEQESARAEAVAIHSAILGVVLMFALADALGDPLKHSKNNLVNALIGSLTAA